jgi:hypothetical protein
MFTHIIFIFDTESPRTQRISGSISACSVAFILKNKKPRLTRRRGDKFFVLFSFFPNDYAGHRPPLQFELELAPALKSKLQPVAVASSGQSLCHSA